MKRESKQTAVTLMSFGFKYGSPNANYYFDVGFIKNPARNEGWDFFSEPTEEMRQYVLDQKEAKMFLEKVVPLLTFLSTVDQHQIFAFGCNSGKHRSNILIEEISSRLEKMGIKTKIYHRNENDGIY